MEDYYAEIGHCTYRHKTMDFRYFHLVKGTNALQFSCERGDCFMAHYMFDNVALRVYVNDNHEMVKSAELNDLTASVSIEGGNIIDENPVVILDIENKYKHQIQKVEFFGCYEDYDENMEGSYGWRYYTFDKEIKGHIGTAQGDICKVIWDTKWIPNQKREMALMACITFNNGMKYATDVTYGIKFNEKRTLVTMHLVDEMPIPFWSRDNNLKEAVITLPQIKQGDEARLQVKNWDGGEGEIKDYFTINDIHHKIASEKAIHKLIYINEDMDINILNQGENKIRLLSDNVHHGIEIVWPGPCIKIRHNK